MIRRILLITIYSLPFLLNAQNKVEKWDLKKCVEYAMQHNISVKQADIQSRIAALQYKQAKLNKLPTANLSTGIGLQFGTSINRATNVYSDEQALYQNFQFSSNMQLYNFGRIKNNILTQQYSAEASLLDIAKASNDAALSVTTYYLQVLSAGEQMNISVLQIHQTEEQKDITNKKVIAGSLPELNLAELEAQLATDSSNYIAAKTNYDQSLLMLKGLLNLDAALPFDIEVPNVDKIPVEPIAALQPEPLYQLALTTQPTQKGNELRIKAAEKNVLVSKAAMYPVISMGINLSSNFYNSFNNYTGYTFNGYTPTGEYVIDKSGNQLSVLSPDYTINQSRRSFSELWNGWGEQLKHNFGQGIGFNISVPLFNNGQAKIGYEQSKLNLKSYTLQQEQANSKLKQDIYTAYTNAINAFQKLSSGQKTIETSQKAYDFAVKRYDNGLLTTLDLLTNQNNLLRAKMQQVVNQFDYVFKMKLLEFYKGQGLKL